jgi:hypothetical protein
MAPINRVIRKGKVRWKVDARAHGTGRRFFESKSDAQRWLDSFQPETGLAEEAWSNLSVIERAKVIATWREITDVGLTVSDVWKAYKELVPVSKPCPLGKAIKALIDSLRQQAADLPQELEEHARPVRPAPRGRPLHAQHRPHLIQQLWRLTAGT